MIHKIETNGPYHDLLHQSQLRKIKRKKLQIIVFGLLHRNRP